MRIEFVGTYEECRTDASKLFSFTSSLEKVKDKEEKAVEETPAAVEETPTAVEKASKEAVETQSDPVTTQVEEVPTEAPEALQNELENQPEASETGEVPLTLENVRARMNGIRQHYGVEVVRNVLAELGFGKVTDVPADRYAELMVLAEAVESGYGAK